MAKKTKRPSTAPTAKDVQNADRSAFFGYLSMLALSLQFGLQPLLNRAFAGNVKSKAFMVIVCEGCKLTLAAASLGVKLRKEPGMLRTWNLVDSLKLSGLPACTYAVQNVLIQLSMQHLTPLEFNLINQSKLLWTAVFVFVLLNRRFSMYQCLAMAMLMGASLLLSAPGSNEVHELSSDRFYYGFVPVIVASILSGLGAAMTQLSLQTHARDASVVTIELCVYGSLFLLGNMIMQPTSLSFEGWTIFTLIPAISTAAGGLLVGTVTQFAGGVMKSYSLIGGIALTGILESFLYDKALSNDLYIASGLVVASMYIYSAYPYRAPAPEKKDQ